MKHDRLDYPEANEDWVGIMGVIIVPLFLFIFGLSLIATQLFHSSAQNNPQIGVGGGPVLLSPSPINPSTTQRDRLPE